NDTGFPRDTSRYCMRTRQPEPPRAIHVVAPGDDVAVAVRELSAGEELRVSSAHDPGGAAAQLMRLRETIPRGHKVALRDIAPGEEVRKYGWPVGRATAAIGRGCHVHTSNLETRLS